MGYVHLLLYMCVAPNLQVAELFCVELYQAQSAVGCACFVPSMRQSSEESMSQEVEGCSLVCWLPQICK